MKNTLLLFCTFLLCIGVSSTALATQQTQVAQETILSQKKLRLEAPKANQNVTSSFQDETLKLTLGNSILFKPTEEQALGAIFATVFLGAGAMVGAVVEIIVCIGNFVAMGIGAGRFGWGLTGLLLGGIAGLVTMGLGSMVNWFNVLWLVHVPLIIVSIINISNSSSGTTSQGLQVTPSLLSISGRF